VSLSIGGRPRRSGNNNLRGGAVRVLALGPRLRSDATATARDPPSRRRARFVRAATRHAKELRPTGMNHLPRTVLHLVLISICLLAGIVVSRISFQDIREMRQLERVPRTVALAALPGEINLNGEVAFAKDGAEKPIFLNATRSNAACVYFKYLKEEERKNSDNKTSWVTVDSREESVDFMLKDESGAILVQPLDARTTIKAEKKLSGQREGKYRYSEWRIEPGDKVFVFAMAEKQESGKIVAGFGEEGDYSPIISYRGEAAERAGMATASVLLCALGLLCFSLAVLAACSLLEVHQILPYLAIAGAALVVSLVYFGLSMMKTDLEHAASRLERHREEATARVKETLQARGVAWNGDWEKLGELEKTSLPVGERELVRRIRVDLARATKRTIALESRFPESWFAGKWGVDVEKPIPIPAEDQRLMDELDAAYEATKLHGGMAGGGALLAVALGLFCSYVGFKLAKVKRYIENIPTSPAKGVAYGLAEVKGVCSMPNEEKPPLTAPVSSQLCVYYSYKVEEYRRSGKNSSWVTVSTKQEHTPFALEDESGKLNVNPAGAEVITTRSASRTEGNWRYSETRLQIGDMLYALGNAVIEPVRMDSLVLAKGTDSDFPFILSNWSERDLMFSKARRGLTALNFALMGVVLGSLLLFGARGAFAASDYLASALVAIGFLGVLTVLFMLNDIVFLRERAKRNWSNIDVSLKKRADLIRGLKPSRRATWRTNATCRKAWPRCATSTAAAPS
jgi:hypothetical protein